MEEEAIAQTLQPSTNCSPPEESAEKICTCGLDEEEEVHQTYKESNTQEGETNRNNEDAGKTDLSTASQHDVTHDSSLSHNEDDTYITNDRFTRNKEDSTNAAVDTENSQNQTMKANFKSPSERMATRFQYSGLDALIEEKYIRMGNNEKKLSAYEMYKSKESEDNEVSIVRHRLKGKGKFELFMCFQVVMFQNQPVVILKILTDLSVYVISVDPTSYLINQLSLISLVSITDLKVTFWLKLTPTECPRQRLLNNNTLPMRVTKGEDLTTRRTLRIRKDPSSQSNDTQQMEKAIEKAEKAEEKKEKKALKDKSQELSEVESRLKQKEKLLEKREKILAKKEKSKLQEKHKTDTRKKNENRNESERSKGSDSFDANEVLVPNSKNRIKNKNKKLSKISQHYSKIRSNAKKKNREVKTETSSSSCVNEEEDTETKHSHKRISRGYFNNEITKKLKRDRSNSSTDNTSSEDSHFLIAKIVEQEQHHESMKKLLRKKRKNR